MRAGLPSVTAIFVASARALASSAGAAACDPGDRAARVLLPRTVNRALSALDRGARVAPFLPRAIALASFGLVDHLALRSLAIDRAAGSALARGIDQIVILGAGLDTRAHRLDALSSATVYEVDHPDTQANKRARAASLPLRADALCYVPVDFTHDSLSLRLDEHGHDPSRRTFWIWEGVVPYLERAAIRATLQAVAERSAAGSELATTYATPALIWMRHTKWLVSLGMRALGEPVRTLLEPDEYARLLVEGGFHGNSDTDTAAWLAMFGGERPLGAMISYERLSLATREAHGSPAARR